MTADIDVAVGRDDPTSDRTLVHRLRLGLIAVAAITVFGTAVELAFQRHWTEPVQFVAWAALLALSVAIALLVREPDRRSVRAARAIVFVVGAAALLGFLEHVKGNYEAGPLDAVYGDQWNTLAMTSKFWLALTQGVGPSPALAPGVLVQAALCLWIATIGLAAADPVP